MKEADKNGLICFSSILFGKWKLLILYELIESPKRFKEIQDSLGNISAKVLTETIVDTYTTNADGQFTTQYYPCGDDWSLREIEPSEGYLLDESAHHIGAEAKKYEVEYNAISDTVDETVKKGNIALIKHTDNGDTQLETPEAGAEFDVYLKSSGSYDAAKDTERDHLVCDENGFAQTKMLPYGIYTVHQTRGWDGRELLADFDVYISENGQTYR